MTDDFKKDLLNYITNNITPTASSDDEILTNIIDYVRSQFRPNMPSYSDLRVNIIQSNTNGYFILYGGYVTPGGSVDTDSRGLIIILDNNLLPIKAIYEFSSGTLLRPIQKMIQLDDGTFVAVDSTIFADPIARAGIQNNEKRFIMLNNFSIKGSSNDYVVRLRISYKIPTDYQNFYCIDIIKNPNSAHYLLAGATYIPTSSGHYDGCRVIDLKINVGSANEWNNTSTETGDYWIYGGFYGIFNSSDVASWKMIITRNNPLFPIAVYWWTGSGSTMILQTNGNVYPYVDSLAMRNQAVFIDYDNIYFVINNQRWGSSIVPRYIGLYKYTFSTSTLKEIYLKNTGSYDYNHSKEGIFLTALNGELYVNYCDNYNYDNKTANYNFQRLKNDVWDPILISEDANYVMEQTLSYTYNIYNLITNVVLGQRLDTPHWKFEIIKEVYNSLNYNSSSYIDYNSLISHSGTIYNNNNIVFARNLYNKTIMNNSTISTIEVPNTMLNDMDITQKNLFGVTNLKLVQDNNTITKNMYETLFLNFINNIGVIDSDTGNKFPLAANYINTNINTGTQSNSETTSVLKVRINYGDLTTKVFNLPWTIIDDYNRQTEFSLYVSKEIESIDYISYDETTIYCSKQLDLMVGNIYTITQYLKVE